MNNRRNEERRIEPDAKSRATSEKKEDTQKDYKKDESEEHRKEEQMRRGTAEPKNGNRGKNKRVKETKDR